MSEEIYTAMTHDEWLMNVGLTLRSIRDHTVAAIAKAMDTSLASTEAVNWSDLSPTEVIVAIDEQGEESFRVMITEAAPDASRFTQWIHDEVLRTSGFSVEVTTEW